MAGSLRRIQWPKAPLRLRRESPRSWLRNGLVALDGHCERPLTCPNKCDHAFHKRFLLAGTKRIEALPKAAGTEKHLLIPGAQPADSFLTESPPPQANDIESDQVCQWTLHETPRYNVSTYTGQS